MHGDKRRLPEEHKQITSRVGFLPLYLYTSVTNGSVLTIRSTNDGLINTADGSIDWRFDTKPGLVLISAVLTCPAD